MKQIADSRHPFLAGLGDRVRALRGLHGLTRKQLAVSTRVSERHLANLEGGTGNVSVLILVELAKAFDVSVAHLLDGEANPSINTSIHSRAQSGSHPSLAPQLATQSQTHLQALSKGHPTLLASTAIPTRIALIGLRGAGKSTLGAALAKELGYVFIETSREIENLAGCNVAEIYNLYGEAGYRRYERQAIKTICAIKEPVVIATPGGIVSNADTFELLLCQCTTVWLQARPLDHLSRVRAQGDNRPMSATRTTQRAAIDDLKSILQAREPEYAKANLTFDTSGYDTATCTRELLRLFQSV